MNESGLPSASCLVAATARAKLQTPASPQQFPAYPLKRQVK